MSAEHDPAMRQDHRAAVSVVIPAYNAERYIERTLAAACTQTEGRLEILVIDDCSTDRTAALVEDAAGHDLRIRLLRTAHNGGPSAARNLGLDAARGEWIALLDADDAMSPERLATLIALATTHGADMASDNLLLVHETGDPAPHAMIPAEALDRERPLSLADFIEGNVGDPHRPRISYGFMKPVIRRDFLQKHAIRYDEHVRFAEDFTLYVRCLVAGAVWWTTPQPLYHYLVRPRSLTMVQTSGDLDRLRRRQRALLAEPGVHASPALTHAIGRHLAIIDRNYFYRSFTDAMKARKFVDAIKILVQTRQSVRLITLESVRQLPIILAKWRGGGYTPQRERAADPQP